MTLETIDSHLSYPILLRDTVAQNSAFLGKESELDSSRKAGQWDGKIPRAFLMPGFVFSVFLP